MTRASSPCSARAWIASSSDSAAHDPERRRLHPAPSAFAFVLRPAGRRTNAKIQGSPLTGRPGSRVPSTWRGRRRPGRRAVPIAQSSVGTTLPNIRAPPSRSTVGHGVGDDRRRRRVRPAVGADERVHRAGSGHLDVVASWRRRSTGTPASAGTAAARTPCRPGSRFAARRAPAQNGALHSSSSGAGASGAIGISRHRALEARRSLLGEGGEALRRVVRGQAVVGVALQLVARARPRRCRSPPTAACITLLGVGHSQRALRRHLAGEGQPGVEQLARRARPAADQPPLARPRRPSRKRPLSISSTARARPMARGSRVSTPPPPI